MLALKAGFWYKMHESVASFHEGAPFTGPWVNGVDSTAEALSICYFFDFAISSFNSFKFAPLG
jgi:hypothetical protein